MAAVSAVRPLEFLVLHVVLTSTLARQLFFFDRNTRAALLNFSAYGTPMRATPVCCSVLACARLSEMLTGIAALATSPVTCRFAGVTTLNFMCCVSLFLQRVNFVVPTPHRRRRVTRPPLCKTIRFFCCGVCRADFAHSTNHWVRRQRQHLRSAQEARTRR
jgi:hypothetical protein